eukprot:TRINITY_DN7989_c0_g1_i3.p1 TRINITY_DN7989_c0_g1~~TRINITY_DN7989_c0_g1_i3.p1  ORF type:complete len:213 (-),score=24.10 TRINITY_DN7989_c0_g1_i3:520-1158(-)
MPRDIWGEEIPAVPTEGGISSSHLHQRTTNKENRVSLSNESSLVPDRAIKACSSCREKFTLTRRRHHCRMCGGLFCDTCTKERVQLPGFGKEPQRICRPCQQVRHEEAHVEDLDGPVLTWNFSLTPDRKKNSSTHTSSSDGHTGLFEATGHEWGHGRLSGASDEFASMQEEWLGGKPHMADIKKQRRQLRSRSFDGNLEADKCQVCTVCIVS